MHNQLFIDGRFIDALDGDTLDVVNPHDGSLITRVAAGAQLDIDRAVARRAAPFPHGRASRPANGAGCWRGWPMPSRRTRGWPN